MNEDSPSFWTKLVNIEGKTSKIRSPIKESRLQVKKIKIIEVLFMEENNQFLLPFSYLTKLCQSFSKKLLTLPIRPKDFL